MENKVISSLTVGNLIEQLNLAIEKGYITKEHLILTGGNSDISFITNICLPPVELNPDKSFNRIQILFSI